MPQQSVNKFTCLPYYLAYLTLVQAHLLSGTRLGLIDSCKKLALHRCVGRISHTEPQGQARLVVTVPFFMDTYLEWAIAKDRLP